MACRENRGRVIFLCLELFVVATSLCRSARLPVPRAPDNSSAAPSTSPEILDELEKHLNVKQNQTERLHLHHGRLLIGKHSPWGAALNETETAEDFMDVDTDYQADMGWREQTITPGVGPEPHMAVVERLFKMEPKVECAVNFMKLKVQSAAATPDSLFVVDRGSRLSPLPLSKLPPSCGYTIKSMHRDVVLVAPYDGCFVGLEDDNYVLPLRWWGVPVRMTCPLMRHASSNPPMVTCHADGMIVKTEWSIPRSRIQVNLNGNWEPILKASQRCLFTIVEHPEGVVILVNYAPCLKKRDGLYTLGLAGDGEMKITCPALQPALPEYSKNDSTLRRHPVAFHAPDQSPTAVMSSASHGPGSSQNSEMASESTDQSELAYYLIHPSFLHPLPPNPESPHTSESVKLVPTTSPVSHSKDQGWQTRNHFPLNSQSYVPEPPPSPPSIVKQPVSRLNQDLHPPPFLRPNSSPQVNVEQPGNQKQRFSYQYISYFKQPGSAAHHVELTSSHPSYVEKLPGKPKPSHGQVVPGAQQPEARQVQAHRQDHSFRLKPAFPSANSQPVVSQAPQPEVQQSHVNHGLFKYPIPEQLKPADQLPKRPVAVPQPQATQLPRTFYPQPEPEIQPVGQVKAIFQPLELDFPQGQVQHPSHNHHKLESPSFENPAASSRSHQAEVFQGQVHQPMNLYPHLDVNSQPRGRPPPSTHILGEAHKDCEKFTIPIMGKKNVSTEANLQSAHPPNYKPPQIHMQHPFNFFYDPRESQYPQPRTLPPGISVNQQVASATEHQTSTNAASKQTTHDDTVQQTPQLSSPQMPLLDCSKMCAPDVPRCCPQVAFHQHLHHMVPVGSHNAPLMYLGQPFVPSSAYSGDGLGYALAPQTPTTESKIIQLTTTTSPAFVSSQSPPAVSEAQTYLQPQDGNPIAPHGSNPSKAANLNEPVSSHLKLDSPFPQWPFTPQIEDLYPLAHNNHPFRKEHQSSQLSAGNTNGPSGLDFVPFIGQYPQEQRMKVPATGRSFEKKPSERKGFVHYGRSREPPHMLPDTPTPARSFALPKNSPLKTIVRGSYNLTKHEQPPNAFSELEFFALPLHGSQNGRLIDFSGSSKPNEPARDGYSGAPNLTKHSGSQPHDPKNLFSKQPKWLDEEMSNPVPGNIYTQKLNSDSTSPLFTSALNGPPGLFLYPDPSVDATRVKGDFPESLHDQRKSLTPLGPSPNLPPHVLGKMFRRVSTADQQTRMLNAPLQMEHTDEKRR